MNLLSCDGCGIVMDMNKIAIPDIQNEDDVGYNMEVAMRTDEDRYVPGIKCPVCGTRTAFENWKGPSW